MAVAVTQTNLYFRQTQDGAYIRKAKLAVTGLAAGNNTAAHGLKDVFGNGVTPLSVELEPTSAGPFNESQPSDSTNIYVNAGGAGTTCTLYVEY